MIEVEGTRPYPLALIGAPTDVGAGHRGGAMGPEALRVAGIEEALRQLGHEVTDLGNLSGPVNPKGLPSGGYRHLEEVTRWCTVVRDTVHDVLVQGQLPILLGGDHSLSIGSIAAVSRFCADRGKPLSVLWLDAHADFNTPETTPSGNIHGMPVAVISGHGPTELSTLGPVQPTLSAERVIEVGVRSVDRVEKTLVAERGLEVVDMRQIDETGTREVMERVLSRLASLSGHVHVSFDVDFVDPMIAPGVATPVAGGPSYREAQLCMEMIHDSGLMGSLDVTELNPAFDHHNQTGELVVGLCASLFGQQILSRHHFTL